MMRASLRVRGGPGGLEHSSVEELRKAKSPTDFTLEYLEVVWLHRFSFSDLFSHKAYLPNNYVPSTRTMYATLPRI